MRFSQPFQYTRKLKASHVLIAAMLAAGGLPLLAAPNPEPPPMVQRDIIGGGNWGDDLVFFAEFLWELLNRWPPPRLELPPGALLADFNEGYATVGIRTNLTQSEREQFGQVALDLMAHLASEPERLEPEIYNQSMDTLAAILIDLDLPEDLLRAK
jgi:hypothetical protein